MESKESNLLKEVPVIHNTDELKMYLKPLYIIDNYMHDKDVYNEFLEKLFNIVRGSFCIKECRTYPIKFKFYAKDKATNTLELRHFLINMIMWFPFIDLDGANALNKEFIFDCNNGVPNINDYINEKIIILMRDFNVKNTVINYDISTVLYNLRQISLDFSVIMGLNFSLDTFITGYEENQELHDMMETTIEDTMQPYDIENMLKNLEEREIDIFKNTKDHPVGVILRANSGIKHKIVCALAS